jgi:hypothetical protein
MSSQGPTGAAGYTYALTRDAQDWTKQLKERRLYASYSDGLKDMSPSWLKFGNDIRLSFNQGRLSCLGPTGCQGDAFSGVVPLVPSEGGGDQFTTGTLQFLGGSSPSYVRIADKEGFGIGSSDFTVEWWMNMSTGNPGAPRVFAYSYGANGSGGTAKQILAVSIEGSDSPGGREFYIWNSTNYGGFGNVSFTFPDGLYDSWHHFALVGEGGNSITVYIDGATDPAWAFTPTYNVPFDADTNQAWNIGAYPQDGAQAIVSFVGYMTDFRVVNGTAVYTTPFTRPNTALTAITNSVLLLNATTEGTAFDDTSLDAINSVVTTVGSPPPVWSSQALF